MPLIQWIMQNLNTEVCGGRGSLKIKFMPGDLVYDCHNKPWVIVGFEFDANKQQPVYNVTDNYVNKSFLETQLSSQPTYTEKLLVASEQLACLNSKPCGNSPVYSGRRYVNKSFLETQLSSQPTYTEKLLVASEQLACLNSKPCGNSPVYSGRRKVKK